MAFWGCWPAVRNRRIRPLIRAEPSDRVLFLCFAAGERPTDKGCFHASRVRLLSKAVRLAAATELICGCHTGGKPPEPVRKMVTKRVETTGNVKLAGQSHQIQHGRWRVVVINRISSL